MEDTFEGEGHFSTRHGECSKKKVISNFDVKDTGICER